MAFMVPDTDSMLSDDFFGVSQQLLSDNSICVYSDNSIFWLAPFLQRLQDSGEPPRTRQNRHEANEQLLA